MPIAHSRLTAQGQISVPAAVRKRLGLGPGSVLEWSEHGSAELVVKRAGRSTCEDVHRVLFGDETPKRGIDVKDGIRDHLRRRYARN